MRRRANSRMYAGEEGQMQVIARQERRVKIVAVGKSRHKEM